MLTYRHKYEGNVAIVEELYHGRIANIYHGKWIDNGNTLLLFTIKGGFGGEKAVPYKSKKINWRLTRYMGDQYIPPSSPKKIEPPPKQDPPDNSPYCGHQLKLI